MILPQYFGKTVVVETIDKLIFRGKVIDILSEEDSENEEKSIIIRDIKTNRLIEFYEKEISSIDIIK